VFQTTGIREGIRIEIGMGEVDRSKPSSSESAAVVQGSREMSK
jgi:hypothetical protein